MKRRHFDNKTLDEIGKNLIKADLRPQIDVEKIVANPGLFDAVRARISADPAPDVKRKFFLLNARTATSLASLAVVFAALIFVFGIFKPGTTGEIAERQLPPTQSLPAVTRSDEPDSIGPVSPAAVDRRIRPEKAVVKQYSKTGKAKRNSAAEANFEGDFYAVSYAGDPNETDRGRIIRVDMSRSALFAMGVNIPLENEAEVVKTDLLIGSDGVTRGIRVVK